MTQYAAALASSPDRWKNEQSVSDQLAHHKLTDDRFFTAYASLDGSRRYEIGDGLPLHRSGRHRFTGVRKGAG